MSEIATEKSKLRQHFSAIRSEISIEKKEKSAANAAKNFLASIPVSSNDIIGAYYPTTNEISPLPILKELSKNGNITALPVIIDKNTPLIFRTWKEGDALCEDKLFKVKEPLATAPQVAPTIMIVPLLAFDLSGNRLGYGGGFFDHTIRQLKQQGNLITVGLAFSPQQATLLPIHSHDHLLDYVVTETEVIRIQ